ncbi:MAG: serine/threonine protein kinase [Myxococcaceae bacterium]|nr:serine/threonine protein kinase [Myxococcaceae bacterium]
MRMRSYQVLFELGRGGMGTVYLGRVCGSGDFERLVAIKRQRERRSGFDEPTERFLNEARLAGLVHHANVVGIHQAGIDTEGYYFVCDYVEGASLAGLVHATRPHPLWPVAIVTRVMLDALAGLQAVHDAVDTEGRPLGMLHRDVAVDNLLVGRDGVTRLADFGIAKASRSMPLTDVGLIRGKLPYLAPEYLRAEAVDKTFDVYAAGVTLWVALTGQLPWGDRSEVHVMQTILSESIPSIAKEGSACSPELDAVIARACHRDPRARFQSARAMLDALESAVSQAGPIASHVQVAEYVESVVGPELAARRARIQARRRELDGDLADEPAPEPNEMKPTVRLRRAGGASPSSTPPAPSITPSLAPPTHQAEVAPVVVQAASRFTPPTQSVTPSGSGFALAAPSSRPPMQGFTLRAGSFAPLAPSVAKPAPPVALPAPRTAPARSFTSPAPRPAGPARSFTPPTARSAASTPSFTPPTWRAPVPAAAESSTYAEPVRLPISPALPRLALIGTLLLMLLTSFVLALPGTRRRPTAVTTRALAPVQSRSEEDAGTTSLPVMEPEPLAASNRDKAGSQGARPARRPAPRRTSAPAASHVTARSPQLVRPPQWESPRRQPNRAKPN